MISEHLDIFTLAERLHRKFLDLIQSKLDGLGVKDLNSVRALILINLGEAEIEPRELMRRGAYQGSNLSYNLKKLVGAGYINQIESPGSRKLVRIKNSDKGIELCRSLIGSNFLDSRECSGEDENDNEILQCRRTLRTLEISCNRSIALEEQLDNQGVVVNSPQRPYAMPGMRRAESQNRLSS